MCFGDFLPTRTLRDAYHNGIGISIPFNPGNISNDLSTKLYNEVEETYMWNNEQARHIFCHSPVCSISWSTSTQCHRNSLIHLYWREVAPAHSRFLVSGRDSHHCYYGEFVLRISKKKLLKFLKSVKCFLSTLSFVLFAMIHKGINLRKAENFNTEKFMFMKCFVSTLSSARFSKALICCQQETKTEY